MEQFLYYFLNPGVAANALAPMWHGFRTTLAMIAIIVPFGLALGLALAALRTLRTPWLSVAIIAFVDFFRAVPAVVLMVVAYFGFAHLDMPISAFFTAVIVLVFTLSAFAEEIFWGAILSIDRGQWEASRANGFDFGQTLAWVVLPQAIRYAMPPLTSRTVAVLTNTSVATVISVEELMYSASQQQGLLANPTPLTMAAIGFLLVYLPFVRLSRALEQRVGAR
jgi:His/Glu/Gln/Arg/opine family amino acid ABC transporter permease subunit